MNPNQKPRQDDQDYQDQVAHISSIKGNEQAMNIMEARYINQKFDDKQKEIYETSDDKRNIQDQILPLEDSRKMYMQRLGFTVENSPKEPMTEGQTAAIEQHYSEVHRNRDAAEITELEMKDAPFRAHFYRIDKKVGNAIEDVEYKMERPDFDEFTDADDIFSHSESLREIERELNSIHGFKYFERSKVAGYETFEHSKLAGWPVEGLAHIPHCPTWKDLPDLPAWQSVLPKLNEVGIHPDFDAIKNEQLKMGAADVAPTVKPQAGTLAEALAQIKSQPKPDQPKPENGIPPRPRRRM